MKSIIRSIVCAAIIGAFASAGARAGPAAELLGVRFGAPDASTTRIVIDLSGAAEYAIDDDGKDNRLAIVFKQLSAKSLKAPGSGLVAGYRVEAASDGARIELEFSASARVKEHFLIAPGGDVRKYRLVVDVQKGARPTATVVASAPVPQAVPPPTPPLAAPTATAAPAPAYADLTAVLEDIARPAPVAEAKKAESRPNWPVIVIDPGHGGADPGASAAGGATEKAVTLAAAKRLSEILQARGRFRIVLTRADDTRLALDQRARFASEAGADLFISLHADAHEDASVRGGSVYTLSKDGTARAAREARDTGNYHDVYALDLNAWAPDVSRILYDKAQTATVTNSGQFAGLLLKRLAGATPLLNNSHRVADLKVLLSPDVPAVLFELAFMSNARDAANLTSPVWREKTMTAVADAIDEYFAARPEPRHASGS